MITETVRRMTNNLICGGKCGDCRWLRTLDSTKACDKTFEPISENPETPPEYSEPKKETHRHFCSACGNQGVIFKGTKTVPCHKCKGV